MNPNQNSSNNSSVPFVIPTKKNTQPPVSEQANPVAISPTPPPIPIVPLTPEQIKANELANAKYAQALIEMVNVNYDEQHPDQAKKAQFLTPKQIIFFGVLIIVSIVGTVLLNQFNSSSKSSSSSGGVSQSKQLLHSAETFNNPKDY